MRRNQVDNANLKTKISESLPDEIAGINPEDLIVSAKRTKPRSIQSFLSGQSEDGVDILPYNSKENKGTGIGMAFAVMGLLMVVGLGLYVKNWVAGFSLPMGDNTVKSVYRIAHPRSSRPKASNAAVLIDLLAIILFTEIMSN